MKDRRFSICVPVNRAFTLIELMVVVAILGVLASVAIPGYTRYLKKSKTVEVYQNLRKIYDGEMAYYLDEHVDVSGKSITRQFVLCFTEPPEHPLVNKKLANFERPHWQAIHFSVDGPVLYSYQVEVFPDPGGISWPSWVPPFGETPPAKLITAFVARGFGDIDGDGLVSEFGRIGFIEQGMSEPEGSRGVYALDQLE